MSQACSAESEHSGHGLGRQIVLHSLLYLQDRGPLWGTAAQKDRVYSIGQVALYRMGITCRMGTTIRYKWQES